MIDNHPDAYPQTGLDHAAVVFEALAEFGVTRFMAVYAPGITPDAPQIGPIRSTRLYFAQWALGFHALYAHAGGSPQGLALVESTDQLINLDALKKASGGYFARDSARDAPHNLYTSSAELERAGFTLIAPGNAPATDLPKTIVYDITGKTRTSKRLAKQLGAELRQGAPDGIATSADIVVIVGQAAAK